MRWSPLFLQPGLHRHLSHSWLIQYLESPGENLGPSGMCGNFQEWNSGKLDKYNLLKAKYVLIQLSVWDFPSTFSKFPLLFTQMDRMANRRTIKGRRISYTQRYFYTDMVCTLWNKERRKLTLSMCLQLQTSGYLHETKAKCVFGHLNRKASIFYG